MTEFYRGVPYPDNNPGDTYGRKVDYQKLSSQVRGTTREGLGTGSLLEQHLRERARLGCQSDELSGQCYPGREEPRLSRGACERDSKCPVVIHTLPFLTRILVSGALGALGAGALLLMVGL